jgi:uncharacterized protein (TIGR03437 family)
MKILRFILFTTMVYFAISFQTLAQAQVWSIYNSASWAVNSISPRHTATIFSGSGGNFTNQTVIAPPGPLPTELGGVKVQIVDSQNVSRFADLTFVSPTQINLFIPADVAVGDSYVYGR